MQKEENSDNTINKNLLENITDFYIESCGFNVYQSLCAGMTLDNTYFDSMLGDSIIIKASSQTKYDMLKVDTKEAMDAGIIEMTDLEDSINESFQMLYIQLSNKGKNIVSSSIRNGFCEHFNKLSETLRNLGE